MRTNTGNEFEILSSLFICVTAALASHTTNTTRKWKEITNRNVVLQPNCMGGHAKSGQKKNIPKIKRLQVCRRNLSHSDENIKIFNQRVFGPGPVPTGTNIQSDKFLFSIMSAFVHSPYASGWQFNLSYRNS